MRRAIPSSPLIIAHRGSVSAASMRVMSSAMNGFRPRRFAPLKEGAEGHEAPRLKGVVFDVDGTLCEPQTYMFAEMRSVLGITKTTDILNHIYSLPPENQHEAMAAIRAIESTAMKAQVPQPGLAPLMAYLDRRNIPKGICTRNFDGPVAHLLANFLAGSTFHPIVTRDFRPPKPDPAGILHIARSWGLVAGGEGGARDPDRPERGVADASGLIMVGDSMDDMAAGRGAGAATVLLVNDVNGDVANHENTDLVISRLDELIDILEEGFEGRIVGQAQGQGQGQGL